MTFDILNDSLSLFCPTCFGISQESLTFHRVQTQRRSFLQFYWQLAKAWVQQVHTICKDKICSSNLLNRLKYCLDRLSLWTTDLRLPSSYAKIFVFYKNQSTKTSKYFKTEYWYIFSIYWWMMIDKGAPVLQKTIKKMDKAKKFVSLIGV